MSEPHLIAIVCKSKTGTPVTFHVQEIISIDGRPLIPDQNDIIANLLTRVAALEAAVSKTTEDDQCR